MIKVGSIVTLKYPWAVSDGKRHGSLGLIIRVKPGSDAYAARVRWFKSGVVIYHTVSTLVTVVP